VRWLIAYGTLRSPEVVEALLGRSVPARPATLDGWYPAELVDRDYPVLLHDPAARCEIDLVGPISDADHQLVTEWEDSFYETAEWTVDGVTGTVFLPVLDHPDLPELGGVWSYERFRERDLPTRLAHMWA
jgi:hypothetical protein